MNNKSNSIGLVLSGGGAKGAFQVGAWKAMCTFGYAERVSVVSGTSVGAINGSVIAPSIGKACLLEKFWRENIDKILNFKLEELINSKKLMKYLLAIKNGPTKKTCSFPGIINSINLKKILLDLVPKDWTGNVAKMYVTSLQRKEQEYALERFELSKIPEHVDKIDRIMASSAFPVVFNPTVINEKEYVDGGWSEKGGDNTPIEPILDEHPEIKTIIVVHCTPVKIPLADKYRSRNVDIIEIGPNNILQGPVFCVSELTGSEFLQDLSGTLAFGNKYISDYIRQGYIAASQKFLEMRKKDDQLIID